jgi:hypothetical protein
MLICYSIHSTHKKVQSMSQEGPPAKKPRSQAQILAFERARKCRDEAIIKKHLDSQKGKAPEKPEPEPEPEQEPEDAMDVQEPVSAVKPQQLSTPVQEPQVLQQDQEEFEYVSFDPDEIRGQLQSTQAELQALRETVQGLHGKQSDLESTWQQHNVRSANMLNFV